MDSKTQLAPLSSHVALDRLLEQVDTALAHGAQALMGSKRTTYLDSAFMWSSGLCDIGADHPA